MIENAVSNNACLIALDRIGRLELLSQSFKQVFVPPAVMKEFGRNVNWFSIKHVENTAVITSLKTQIGEGESEAIALTMELRDTLVILDDKKARRIAKQLGIKVIGTIGLLLRAKKKGFISEVKPLLGGLQGVGFRISSGLYQRVLDLAKEL